MLPARFHALRGRTLAVVDQACAEPIMILPLKNGRADPDRDHVEIEAILRTNAGNAVGMSGGNAQAWQIPVAATGGTLFVNRARYDDLALAAGDKVRALSRPGQPFFEVLHVDGRSHTRLAASLGEAK